ncbi:MAG: phytanoyl-CoA dioxygenase [Candidatus Thermofonsia Clade 1 bacterium]|jgi:ectoine hydroxylase-related dioxygenase (phytanoyl-CoA dioxygenase family)|uniref:Phytanoyl-CoA dioxygenase n=1 Tax=Candidatus Thermofonsia Clade 1 bacterium TaxID=2364210 RepID=A0A2M8P1Q3_9CHLR|nr:MAG: phytanoyl-CoA dioxygenase [Candidatus Thermofonsia Clade 1 bacterium]
MLTQQDKHFYDQNGYVVGRGLFTAEEAAFYRDYYTRLRESGTYPGDDLGVVAHDSADPLKRYPRMIHMHRWDSLSRAWLLDPRLGEALTLLLGKTPYAVQTMLYFKPPGARGQALHQDNYYLRVQNGTCMAAWMALDPCDEANGCLMMVPGSHTWDLLCTIPADTAQSFTDVTVPLPEGCEVHPVAMQPGDVLFFNGAMVHGSNPNVTTDRFRRALIGHYIEADAMAVAEWYNPVLRFDGAEFRLQASPLGGKCGVWVERDGKPVLELNGEDITRDATKL